LEKVRIVFEWIISWGRGVVVLRMLVIPEALAMFGTGRTPGTNFNVVGTGFPTVAVGAFPEEFCGVIDKDGGEALAIFALGQFLHISNC
jgi:hypothetical protein